jgi:hypothetical protein
MNTDEHRCNDLHLSTFLVVLDMHQPFHAHKGLDGDKLRVAGENDAAELLRRGHGKSIGIGKAVVGQPRIRSRFYN